jgi:hypothetical protein
MEREPTDELAARFLFCGPVAVGIEAFVVREDPRQDDVLDLFARSRLTAVDVALHLGIAVEIDEQVDVVRGEATQPQSVGFEDDLHPRNL